MSNTQTWFVWSPPRFTVTQVTKHKQLGRLEPQLSYFLPFPVICYVLCSYFSWSVFLSHHLTIRQLTCSIVISHCCTHNTTVQSDSMCCYRSHESLCFIKFLWIIVRKEKGGIKTNLAKPRFSILGLNYECVKVSNIDRYRYVSLCVFSNCSFTTLR